MLAEAAQRLSAEALYAAKAAAAVMGMNNIYYRFQHLSGNEKYGQIPARLRMQVIRTHGWNPWIISSGHLWQGKDWPASNRDG